MNTSGEDTVEISHNTFMGNGHAIVLQPARTLDVSVDLVISGNNFVDSAYDHLVTHEYINSDIVATGNWWGTTDETEIEGLIYDYNDDLNLPKVIWHPFLTSSVED